MSLKSAAESLVKEIAELKTKLHEAEHELREIQIACQKKKKHHFVLSGFDTKYFYAICETCQFKIRYDHGFESKIIYGDGLNEDQKRSNKDALNELEQDFRSKKPFPVTPEYYEKVY